MPPWQAFTLYKGARLVFDSPKGVCAYLAVSGGFQDQPVLGSLACVTREGLGGHTGEGKPLAEGETLRIDTDVVDAIATGEGRTVPERECLDYMAPATLELIPGAQIAGFTGASLFRAFHDEWRVDARADRMGVRLTGPRLECRLDSMISEGIALGALQVTRNGQPIALLNDRQAVGGYPRLGTLTPLACARLAQCQPGQTVHLAPVAMGAAQDAYRRFLAAFC